jgi:hypothetical protein
MIDLTDAIEAGAQTLWAFALSESPEPWDDADAEDKDVCRQGMRAVLEAAAPLIATQVAERIAVRAETFRGFALEAGDQQRAEVWDSAARIARDEIAS